MRIALVLVLVLAGCAKKQAPAKAPPSQTMENKAQDSVAPGGAETSPQDEKDSGGQTKGDPCDGGETKSKKK